MLIFLSSSLFRAFDSRFNVLSGCISGSHDNCAKFVRFSLKVANALARLHRWNEALPYLQLAQKLEKAPARQKEITGKLAEVRTVLRRERLNLARQPILHQELVQDRVVRPRLVAQVATPGKASTTGGE